MKRIFYAMLICSFSLHAMEKAGSKQSNSEKERLVELISIGSQSLTGKLSIEAKANSIVTTLNQRTQSMDTESAKAILKDAYIELESLKIIAYRHSQSKHKQMLNRDEQSKCIYKELESVWQEYRTTEVKIVCAQHDLLKYGTQNSVFTFTDIKYIDKQLSGIEH